MRKLNNFQQKKAIDFYKKGINQKQISIKLQVTQKTVGIWLKEYKVKQQKKKEQIQLLNYRLDILLNSNNSNTSDIENITKAISNLELS